MRYRAVLFDMDGVLINTRPSIETFWNDLARDYHIILTDADMRERIHGCPVFQTLDQLFPQLGSSERQTVHERLIQYETEQIYHEIPGALAFLKRLNEVRIPIALVTSGEAWKIRVVFEQLGMDALFTALVTAEAISRGKPDPACYILAARRLGLPPEECLVCEDALSGVTAAVNAGASCIGIGAPAEEITLKKAGSRWVIPDFTEVRVQPGCNEAEKQLHLNESTILLLQCPGE